MQPEPAIADLADLLHLAPDVRMTAYAFRELTGRPPALVWQVPGTVTLLADGPRRLTAAARWGAIAAAAPSPDGVAELIHMNRPRDRTRLTTTEAAATVLVSTGPPIGSGLGAAAATETAVALCLRDLAATLPVQAVVAPCPPDLAAAVPAQSAPPGPHALLDGRPLPFDLASASLRLAVIDTRVRGVPRPPATEHAPVDAAATVLTAGHIEALAPLLTAAHQAHPGDGVQQLAVSAALSAGALGARAIADGPGRPVCALLPAHRLPGIRSRLAAEFARHGLRTPRLVTITPAPAPAPHRT